MKTSLLLTSAGVIAAWLPLAADATTAIALSSFEGIEEPLVRYSPGTGAFVRDDLANIVDLGDGVFRMRLRYQSDQWDADRDTHNTDRQRAEVKGLGVHQKTGETFEYSTSWRTNREFKGACRFCHVFQLKSTDGDSGAPVITISIDEDLPSASVRYWSGHAKQAVIARQFPWKPGVWQTVRLRIRTSEHDGEVLVSIDGDAFQGARGVPVYRPDATDYRPKWGLYRGVKSGLPLGDDYVEHKNISALKLGDATAADSSALTLEARQQASVSPGKTTDWLLSRPRSPGRDEALATVTTDWACHDPAAAMGFVENMKPADGRAQAMLRVFNRWTDRDPDAVLRWVAARAPAAELDPLLWYFATDTTLRYTARDKALTAAQLIADPELRARAIEHVVLIWARHEPIAAARYVDACTSLSVPKKADIVGKIRRTGS